MTGFPPSALTYQSEYFWNMEQRHHQRLAWQDAEDARIARRRAERRAAAQLKAMLEAHPSGGLGNAKLNDLDALIRSGLL